MKGALVVAGLAMSMVAAVATAHADPLTPEQERDARVMAADWCTYIRYSDSPEQGVMLALDDADDKFHYPESTTIVMVAFAAAVQCPSYAGTVGYAARTWQRIRHSSGY